MGVLNRTRVVLTKIVHRLPRALLGLLLEVRSVAPLAAVSGLG